jgi:hypothetical protein
MCVDDATFTLVIFPVRLFKNKENTSGLNLAKCPLSIVTQHLGMHCIICEICEHFSYILFNKALTMGPELRPVFARYPVWGGGEL